MAQVRFRDNVVISVMMIDVDRFKQINDTFGHAEGDRALMLVSESLKRTCGQIKVPIFIGRYGGDEFTLIIQDPGEDDRFPEQVAEKVSLPIMYRRHLLSLVYRKRFILLWT